jgi:uncharacterized protein DUF4157/protein-glutamine gamma-glutamyltransferase-like protein
LIHADQMAAAMFAPKTAKAQTRATASSQNDLARQKSTHTGHRAGKPLAEHAHVLDHGNQGPRRMPGPFGSAPLATSLSATGVLQRKCACGAPAEPVGECAECKAKRDVQPKGLAINETGDPLEHEADRVAEQVMRMPQPQAPARIAHEPVVQRSAAQQPAIGAVPPVVRDVLRSAGQPLDADTRAFMEPRFGFDFSRVRIHADGQAAEAARAVHARAFTLGRDVVFATGRHAPATVAGRQLLAHELTHVVQQQAGFAGAASRASGLQMKSATEELPVREQGATQQAQTSNLTQSGDPKLDELKDKIRAELSKKKDFTEDVIAAMMQIEEEMAAKQTDFKSKKVGDIVHEIEMRYFVVQTMLLVAQSGRYRLGNRYRISDFYWQPFDSESLEPFGSASTEQGYRRNIFSPNYHTSLGSTVAKALEDIFDRHSSSPVVLDCNAMMVAMQYEAVRRTFGDPQFNEMFPEGKQGLFIGPVGDPAQEVYPPYGSSAKEGKEDHPFLQLGLYTQQTYTPGSFDDARVRKELVIGDWVYFENHKGYQKCAPSGMWSGEHAMYVGDGKFMGFGLATADKKTALTYDEVLKELLDAFNDACGANLTTKDIPGIVARLVPNTGRMQDLPKVKKVKK